MRSWGGWRRVVGWKWRWGSQIGTKKVGWEEERGLETTRKKGRMDVLLLLIGPCWWWCWRKVRLEQVPRGWASSTKQTSSSLQLLLLLQQRLFEPASSPDSQPTPPSHSYSPSSIPSYQLHSQWLQLLSQPCSDQRERSSWRRDPRRLEEVVWGAASPKRERGRMSSSPW